MTELDSVALGCTGLEREGERGRGRGRGRGREIERERERERAVSPSRHTLGCTFFYFFILGEGGEIEGKSHEEDMKELCPNTTHGDKHEHEIKE